MWGFDIISVLFRAESQDTEEKTLTVGRLSSEGTRGPYLAWTFPVVF